MILGICEDNIYSILGWCEEFRMGSERPSDLFPQCTCPGRGLNSNINDISLLYICILCEHVLLNNDTHNLNYRLKSSFKTTSTV